MLQFLQEEKQSSANNSSWYKRIQYIDKRQHNGIYYFHW